ncbi:MAG: LPXTG cell wall anchor domain-containing protein [Clostridiales bacterium]|nr:LPXTG cell wall anchor domain-containing protein [Clostridiales bacterium]
MSVKEQYSDNRKRKRIRFRILFALACIVVFATTYALILPAITMEKEVCGIEEHTHTESCYEVTEASQEQKLICGKEESEEHKHNEECYEIVTVPAEKTLVCGKAEHTHTIDCLEGSDQEAVEKVINLIEELPDHEEIESTLGSLEDDEDSYDAYLEQVMRDVQYAHELYEELGSDLQKYVTNADKLLELSDMWEGQTFADGDNSDNSIDIYEKNMYDSAAKIDNTILLCGATGKSTVNGIVSSMRFFDWNTFIIQKVDGLYTVTEIITAGSAVDRRNCSIPADGFILLVYKYGSEYNSSNNINVGDIVTVSVNGGNFAASASSRTPIGTLTYKASSKKKAEKDNSSELTVVQGADTRDLIEVNLYDYGTNINDLYKSDKKYPGFQQEYGSRDVGDTLSQWLSFNFGNNITSDLAAGIAGVTDAGGKGINATTNVDDPNGQYANKPIEGAMKNVLVDGYPALADGTSLSYLFSQNTYATKRNTQSINRLFQYNSTTGAYTFNSRENHAQFNSSNDTFTLYSQIISSNFMMYPFGNFLPFNDIVHLSKQSSQIDRDYLLEIAASAQKKFENKEGSEYGTLATQLKKFVSLMDKEKGNENWTGADCLKKYFQLAGIPGVPNQSNEEVNRVISNVYTIDYDEPTDFFFGMEMKMNFMQPKGGLTGNDGQQPMVFYFTGDDDVWVYLDGKLALDLSGIHRHVGGEIDFVNGVVKYYDLSKASGDVSERPYKTVKFSDLFGSSVLNDKGTFKDYSTHSFNFYYMERGAGSGVCRMNFNFPLLKQNAISVTKELTTDDSSKLEAIAGNPDFRFQILKENGTELFIPAGTKYTIKSADGNDVGKGTVGENGIFTIKAGQTAVFDGLNENSGKYYVQELISPDEFGQYSNVSVDGSSETTNYNVTVGGDTFKGYKSPVKDVSDGSTIFHFNNKVDFAKLGSLSISKNLIENVGNHKDDYFKFEVKLDGKLIPEGTKYKVGDSVRTVGADSVISIKAGETALIENVLAGTQYSIKEVDYPNTLHPSYSVNGSIQADATEVSGTIRTDTDTSVTVTNTEDGTAGIDIPVTKTVENPDGEDHTYTFNLKQVDKDGNDTIEIPYTSQMNITVSGGDPVTSGFRLGYSEKETGDYYYKISEAPVEETGTVFDTSVYMVHVTVSKDSDGVLKAILTDKRKGDSEYNNDSLEFVNKLNSYELPQTGGPGTILFTLGGILLILAAGSLLIYRRRKGNA